MVSRRKLPTTTRRKVWLKISRKGSLNKDITEEVKIKIRVRRKEYEEENISLL